LEARLTVQGVDGSAPVQSTIRLEGEGLWAPPPLECAFKNVLEVSCPLLAAQADSGSVRFQLSIWKNGLPVDAVPRGGWIEVRNE